VIVSILQHHNLATLKTLIKTGFGGGVDHVQLRKNYFVNPGENKELIPDTWGSFINKILLII
jgi:hypothetical protein